MRALFVAGAHTDIGKTWAACALLRASNLSITEVAVEVGYESYETFARAFRKRRGMSAASWRKPG